MLKVREKARVIPPSGPAFTRSAQVRRSRRALVTQRSKTPRAWPVRPSADRKKAPTLRKRARMVATIVGFRRRDSLRERSRTSDACGGSLSSWMVGVVGEGGCTWWLRRWREKAGGGGTSPWKPVRFSAAADCEDHVCAPREPREEAMAAALITRAESASVRCLETAGLFLEQHARGRTREFVNRTPCGVLQPPCASGSWERPG